MTALKVVVFFLLYVSACYGEIGLNSELFGEVTKLLESTNPLPESGRCGRIDSTSATHLFRPEFYEYKKTNDWMKIYPVDENIKEKMNQLAVDVPKPRLMEFHQDVLKFDWDRSDCTHHVGKTNEQLGKRYDQQSPETVLDCILQYRQSFQPRSAALFHNVYVDAQSFIVDRNTCKAVRQGSCSPRRATFTAPGQGGEVHPFVIGLANTWGGTWHVPMEDIAGMAGLEQEVIDKALVHVTKRDEYTLNWLALLGIGPERVLTGTISVKVLLMMQIRCTMPYYHQQMWMRDKLLPQTEALPFPTQAGAVEGKINLLVIERYANRATNNMQQVADAAEAFAKEHGLGIIHHVHKQGVAFPSLLEQIKRFSVADIVLAPHGAGLLFTNFGPAHNCVIEFMDPPSTPLCFPHLQLLRNASYIQGFNRGSVIDLQDVPSLLKRCLDVVKAATAK